MSMLEFRVSLKGDTPETIERGEEVPPGWYLAELIDAYDDKNKPQLILKFKIAHGLYEGRHLSYWLPDPEYADEDKKKRAEQRVKMLLNRLGLIKENDFGQEEVEGSWLDAIGTEVFLHVSQSKGDDDRDFVGIHYSGVYPLNYEWKKTPKDWPKELDQFRQAEGKSEAAGTKQEAATPAVAGAGVGSGKGRDPNEDQWKGL